MIIGFCTDNKYTDVAAVYEHMSDLSGGNAGDYLKLIELKQSTKYDIVVADTISAARELGVMKADARMLVVFGGDSRGGADLVFASSELHKKHLVNNCGWKKDRVRVVGRPSMDLLWGTHDEKELLRQVFLRSNWVDRERETVLFNFKDATIDKEMWDEILDWIDGELNVIVRGPKMDLVPEKRDNVAIDTSDDPLPRLLAADILVTDFHDETLDYLTLERPVVFLACDILDRWWMPPNNYNLPGPMVTSAKKIIHAIANRDKFPQKYIDNRNTWKEKFVGGRGDSANLAVGIIMKKWRKTHDV